MTVDIGPIADYSGILPSGRGFYPTLVDGRGDVLVELLQPLGHRQLEHIAVRQR